MRCLLSLIFLLLIRFSVSYSQANTDLLQQTSEVHSLMTEYEADFGSLNRFYFVPNSAERRERFEKLDKDYLERLNKLSFEKISQNGKADYILFKRALNSHLQQLQLEQDEMNMVIPLIPFAEQIYAMERSRRRGAIVKGEQTARDLNKLEQDIRSAIKVLGQKPVMEWPIARRAEATIKGLQLALRNVYDFYYGYDPSFTWWVPVPYKTVDSLLGAYAGSVLSKGSSANAPKDDGSGIIGNPIGRTALLQQLEFEMIPYSPEELVEIANKEFAWCDQELLKASREMGFGDNWKQAQEKVKNSYVPEGEQPAAILKLYNESIDFLKKHDLVTIPPVAEETWRMRMMSPQQQLVSPFFLGGETILIAYPTNTMDHDDKLMSMRGNNPHFSRSTVHHELIAGHHLQGFMNNRHKVYRHFGTPFWTEGWALYWELILWDMKFPQSPEDRIGMLFWRMHRCARIIFSLNYHLGKWTPQQCIDFLVDRVGHERANAEGEVRRSFTGNYGPLYQIAYMIGGMQFYALKKELVDSGKMSYKQYHDAVLQENAMPVEMVRALLTKQPLKKDFKTSWRFYK
jgi:hypothetical protein